MSNKSDYTAEAAKAIPPASIAAATTIGGMQLNDWVLVLTIIYLVLQISYLLWKWWKGK